MKKRLGTWMVCSALLVFSAAAAAQPQHPPLDHGRAQGQNHHDQNHRHGMYERGHSEGWYKKGGHVPAEYRGGSHVVTDWRARHLRQPPRGYHYVRSDNGDYLLVAITTGIIASILARH